MVAFGINEIFEPKGMIPVDGVEKSIVGDPSKTIASSGGSWLWLFTFRRSRSRKAMQPTRSDSKTSDAKVASNSIKGEEEAKNVCKPMMAKKMITAITPTSEELASLNLKEGRNTVTFTFFIPMLGKQQVDARIYLWKWNTHIVISDVDGTITKARAKYRKDSGYSAIILGVTAGVGFAVIYLMFARNLMKKRDSMQIM